MSGTTRVRLRCRSFRILGIVATLVAFFPSCWLLNNPLDPNARDFAGQTVDRVEPTRELVSFEFSPEDNPELHSFATGEIVETSVTVRVPNGVDRSSLVPRFVTTGEYVTVDGEEQESGSSAQDFTSPIPYVVHAANGSTESYEVSVVYESPPSFLAFGFAAADNPVLDFDYPSAVGENTITAALPIDESERSLIARFDYFGERVTVDGVEQISGESRQDFADPVTYTVEGVDGTKAVYTVEVVKPFQIHVSASTGNDATADGTIARPYRTLAAAKDAVSDLDGIAEVRFAEGSYEGPVEVARDTIIAGGYAADFSDWNPGTYVSEITNPVVTGGDWDFGQGVDEFPNYTISFVEGVSAQTVLTGFTVHAGGGQDAAAIMCSASSPSIQQNVISPGSATGSTVGIVSGQGAPRITDNQISLGGSNLKSYGLIVVDPDDYLDIRGNTIDAGASTETSIGVYVENGAGEARQNSIRGGESGFATGMVIVNPVTDFRIEDNTIQGGVSNSTLSPSGIAAKGITVSGGPGPVIVRNNTITGGTTTVAAFDEPQTIGVELVDATALVEDNPLIAGGESSFISAGITATTATTTEIRHNTIHGVNPAQLSPSVEIGVGVYIGDTTTGVRIAQNEIFGNRPADAPANNLSAIGIFLDGTSGPVSSVEISDNMAIEGGGAVQTVFGISAEAATDVFMFDNTIVGSDPALLSLTAAGVVLTNSQAGSYRNVVKGGLASNSAGIRVESGGELVVTQNRVVGSEGAATRSSGIDVDGATLRGGSNYIHSGNGDDAYGVTGTNSPELYLYHNTIVAGRPTSSNVHIIETSGPTTGEVLLNNMLIAGIDSGFSSSGFVDVGEFPPGDVAGNNVFNMIGVGADGFAVAGTNRNVRVNPNFVDLNGSDGFHWTIEDNDWRLQSASPLAITDGVTGDVGLLNAWYAAIGEDPVDFFGNPRTYVDAPVSMGAAEFRGGSLPAESNLALWYRADDIALADGRPVSTWPDRSASGIAATALGGFEPKYKATELSGLPAVEFDDSSEMNLGVVPGLHATGEITALIVADPEGTANTHTFVESQDTIADPAWRLHWDGSVSTVRAQAFDGGLVSATSAADDLPHIYGFGLNAASVRVMVDGTMGSTPLTAAFTGHMETRLGYSDVDGHHLRGVMGEILIWDRDLILAEEREAAYYLSARYGIDYGP